MAQLKFYYGTMGSGKTTELLKSFDNAKACGLKPLIIKPKIDNRDGNYVGWGKTKSRLIDVEYDAYYFTDISSEIFPMDFDVLYVDEAQFLTERDVKLLKTIVTYAKRDVVCYGLERDVNNNIFDGTYFLMRDSDERVEMKQKCQHGNCGHNATTHVRYINGIIDNDDSSVVIESDDVTYKSVCYAHWKELRGVDD